MMTPRVGLVGYAPYLIDDGSNPVGAAAVSLWRGLPFCCWMVPPLRHTIFGLNTPARTGDNQGRVITFLAGCAKSAKTFLADVDVVVSLRRCWPDQLFYFAREQFGVRTILLADPQEDLTINSHWFRYADLVIAPEASTAQQLREQGFPGPLVVATLPWGGLKLSVEQQDNLWNLLIAGP